MKLFFICKRISTIFKRIINKEIKADIVYETENILVFKDIAPVAPIHLLIIPKKEIPRVSDSTIDDINILGELVYTAKIVAEKLKITEGFRLVINNGKDGGQTVDHIHIHLIGGKQLGWPPGVDSILDKNKKI